MVFEEKPKISKSKTEADVNDYYKLMVNTKEDTKAIYKSSDSEGNKHWIV